jgi:hypothetical protein
MADFEGAVLIGSEVDEYPRIDLVYPEVSSMQHTAFQGMVPSRSKIITCCPESVRL